MVAIGGGSQLTECQSLVCRPGNCLRLASDWAKLSRMEIMNIHEAKTQLSRLINRAVAGEEIVIGRAGEPLVKLVPYRLEAGPRRGGQWQGRVWMAEDFDALPEELARAFRGEGA